MEITLEWTDENIDHIRRHNIEPKEVESFLNLKFITGEGRIFTISWV